MHTAVVVGNEIDCLLVDFTQHLHRERGEPRFGVVADEAVRDEGVVLGIDTEAVHRLHSGVCDRRDARIVEPAVGQLGCDGADIGVSDVRKDLGANGTPALEAIDVVPRQPIAVSPCAAGMLADERRQPGNVVTVPARIRRQGIEDSGELVLFGTAESDLTGKRLGVRSIGDDHLVLASGVAVPLGHHAELKQHLLDIRGQPLAARRVRDLNSVARQQ